MVVECTELLVLTVCGVECIYGQRNGLSTKNLVDGLESESQCLNLIASG